MISVNMVDANVYQVVVEATNETVHRVSMSQEFYRQLCGATVTHEYVLIQAFQYLLERESNTKILPEFDIAEIASYFPEFETQLRQRLGITSDSNG